MTEDFYLLHRTGPERIRLEPGVEAFPFMTCLRHIVVADSRTIADLALQTGQVNNPFRADQVMRGDEAYRFLLEVICGLHSPLFGETEVAGQFKAAIAEFKVPVTPWGSSLAKLFNFLLSDAKTIRALHLKDLGSQSYGSVLRREIRGSKSVHILGAGHLVQEILPWVMKDGLRLTVHVRDVAKATLVLTEKIGASAVQRLSIVKIGSNIRSNVGSSLGLNFGPVLDTADALVIAAPVSASFVLEWAGSTQIRFVADLRADSSIDRLSSYGNVLELGAFMSRLELNQAALRERKSLVMAAIAKAAFERSHAVEYRPFGWEDVCA